MKNARDFTLARRARIVLLTATLGGCALAAAACGSPSAAPSAQSAANNGSANHVATTAPATLPSTTVSPTIGVTSPSAAVTAPGVTTTAQPSAQNGNQGTTQHTNPPAQPPPPGPLTVKLVGLPTSISMGSAPVQFQAVISNPSPVDYPSVAPVFQIVGGPANHVNATLQVYDPATHTWQNTSMPEGDGANPLTYAKHGTDLAPGHSLTVTYRLTVSKQNPAESTAAILYAAAPPNVKALATTGISGRITTS